MEWPPVVLMRLLLAIRDFKFAIELTWPVFLVLAGIIARWRRQPHIHPMPVVDFPDDEQEAVAKLIRKTLDAARFPHSDDHHDARPIQPCCGRLAGRCCSQARRGTSGCGKQHTPLGTFEAMRPFLCDFFPDLTGRSGHNFGHTVGKAASQGHLSHCSTGA